MRVDSVMRQNASWGKRGVVFKETAEQGRCGKPIAIGRLASKLSCSFQDWLPPGRRAKRQKRRALSRKPRCSFQARRDVAGACGPVAAGEPDCGRRYPGAARGIAVGNWGEPDATWPGCCGKFRRKLDRFPSSDGGSRCGAASGKVGCRRLADCAGREKARNASDNKGNGQKRVSLSAELVRVRNTL